MPNPFLSFYRFGGHVLWLLVPLLVTSLPGEAAAQLSVTNVTSAQRTDGSGLVDIGYTLSGADGPMRVSVRVSPDAGATWKAVFFVTGDVGMGITNGTRSIVWNAWADVLDIHWPNAQIEVKAEPIGEGLTLTLPGGVLLELVRIPAGSFVMGSPSSEYSRDSDEGPLTNVTLTRDFYMGKYEVTQAQWKAVMGSGNNPSWFRGDTLPVERVSWNDAQDFISALNAHITSSGQGPATMRLPTEAEWEYACRAGTTTRFYFGDSLGCADDCSDCAAGTLPGNRSDYMWYCGNNASSGQPGYGTKPVGGKLPNAFGLYDMSGNVWELCQDWYGGNYPGGSVTNPTGPASGGSRVVRGGSWGSTPARVRSANRGGGAPTGAFNDRGFRVVAVPRP